MTDTVEVPEEATAAELAALAAPTGQEQPNG